MEVLIVEENQEVALMLDAMLCAVGYSCCVATTLSEAMAAAYMDWFDAYVIDLDFGECGGPAVLGALRREEMGVHAARAVGWTASPDLWRFSRAAGLFDAVLAKPASLRSLMAALQGCACPDCLAPLDANHLASSCQWSTSSFGQIGDSSG